LEDATSAGPVAFFPGADTWAERLVDDGVVLVGDAAGANDPSQGHGLSLAFRDARELRDHLTGTRPGGWSAALTRYAERRVADFAVLRAHAQWSGLLLTEQGATADARRERVKRAREEDPTAGGFAGIYLFGPSGLVADEAARRHFFGEDLAG
jgi:2-polyprenyl-6-methoxyphenol hydroxylase-like FAD-dependent oxidoreductase